MSNNDPDYDNIFEHAKAYKKTHIFKKLPTRNQRIDCTTNESRDFVDKLYGDYVFFSLPENRERLFHIKIVDHDRHTIDVEVEGHESNSYLPYELELNDIFGEDSPYQFYTLECKGTYAKYKKRARKTLKHASQFPNEINDLISSYAFTTNNNAGYENYKRNHANNILAKSQKNIQSRKVPINSLKLYKQKKSKKSKRVHFRI